MPATGKQVGRDPALGSRWKSVLMFYLRLEDDSDPVTFPLKAGAPSTIGREAVNDIVLRRLHVSRRHARVRVADGALVVEDLGSHNGTQVLRVSSPHDRDGADRWLPVPLADDSGQGRLCIAVGDRLRLGGPLGPVLVVAEAVLTLSDVVAPAESHSSDSNDPMATVSTLDVTEDGGHAQLEFLRSLAALSWTTPTSEARRDALARVRDLVGAKRVDLISLATTPASVVASSDPATGGAAAAVAMESVSADGPTEGLAWVQSEAGGSVLMVRAARQFAALIEFPTKPRFSPEALCRLDAILQIACPWIALSAGADDLRTSAAELAARAQAWERTRLGEDAGPGLVAVSAAMRGVVDEALAAARNDLPVLITGETGVGKEVVARLVHCRSARRDHCLVDINCAAMPRDLFESEFFGWTKGAFNDAHADTAGLFEVAHQGTLFLDEVGTLAPDHQAKLLRVLQTGDFRRVGDRRLRHSDVRLVSATNSSLEAAIAKGAFRADLYYRIAAVRIHVPPLRDRRDDVLPLAEATLARLAGEGRTRARAFDVEARRWLLSAEWPGNVRELVSCVERAASRASGAVVTSADLRPQSSASTDEPLAQLLAMPIREAQAEFRRHYLEHLLAACGGNKTRAARHAGVDVRTIRELAREIGRPESDAVD